MNPMREPFRRNQGAAALNASHAPCVYQTNIVSNQHSLAVQFDQLKSGAWDAAQVALLKEEEHQIALNAHAEELDMWKQVDILSHLGREDVIKT